MVFGQLDSYISPQFPAFSFNFSIETMTETDSELTLSSTRPPVFTFGSGNGAPNSALLSPGKTKGRIIKQPSRPSLRGASSQGNAPSSSHQSSPAIVSNTLMTPAASPAREQPSVSSAAFSSPSSSPASNRLSLSPSPSARRHLDSSP